jgi:DNA-binding response OmpR family regulator
LVIDDSNTIRKSAEMFLRQAGYEVILAEDGLTRSPRSRTTSRA